MKCPVCGQDMASNDVFGAACLNSGCFVFDDWRVYVDTAGKLGVPTAAELRAKEQS